jgi:hypothetical protein
MIPPPIINTSTAAVFKERGTHEITTYIRTRAYHAQGQIQTGLLVSIDVQTWASNLTIEFETGRVEDVHQVTSYAPDRTRWLKPANRPAFDGINSAGDFMDPSREDYSVQFGPDGVSELELGDAGIRLDLHQEVQLRALMAGPDRWRTGQLVIENTVGRVRILAVELGSAPVEGRTARN